MPSLALESDTHTLFSIFTKPDFPPLLLLTKERMMMSFSSPVVTKKILNYNEILPLESILKSQMGKSQVTGAKQTNSHFYFS